MEVVYKLKLQHGRIQNVAMTKQNKTNKQGWVPFQMFWYDSKFLYFGFDNGSRTIFFFFYCQMF